ncbi:MAG TPA: competence protein CoiA family protein [Chlamydiales bacterium]|jgi:competence CoiA-like predicted nuclease
MALYAFDEDILVHAADAQERRTYRCSGCAKPVRLRKGPFKIPHFYHLSLSPSCRLYSKSQDHLLAQLAIQQLLPAGETVLEKPFLDVLRVADLVWEPQRLIFEIQCSQLSLKEAERRVSDYGTAGYQVVWILDDRIFNRRSLRPAEAELRQMFCYYATLRKQALPIFYDQFELFFRSERLKKGQRLKVRLNAPHSFPSISFEKERFPSQIQTRAFLGQLYFEGDLLHKALLAAAIPALAFAMENLAALETLLVQKAVDEGCWWKKLWQRWVVYPFDQWMLRLLKWAERC